MKIVEMPVFEDPEEVPDEPVAPALMSSLSNCPACGVRIALCGWKQHTIKAKWDSVTSSDGNIRISGFDITCDNCEFTWHEPLPKFINIPELLEAAENETKQDK